MPEIRKDPFTDEQVIIAMERAKRPTDFHDDGSNKEEKTCFFCRGREKLTPSETFRIDDDNGEWIVRSFPNKFPILCSDMTDGNGIHEVIVDNCGHDKSFFNMNIKEFKYMLLAYKNRYIALYNTASTQYVSIFKNYLKKAGASLDHPHSQIISLPIIPNIIMTELNNCKKFYEYRGEIMHQVLIREERDKGDRVIFETDNFIVIAPFASKYNYETQIIYKNKGLFQSMTDRVITELSEVLFGLFSRYGNVLGRFPFNLFLHAHPNLMEDAPYNWHLHITPRVSQQAGFELSTGIYVNDIPPEKAAKLMISAGH